MANKSRNTVQILLYSTLILVVPMVLFPELLGTQLLRPSLINLFFEIGFYSVVLWVMNRDWPMVHLAGGVGLCAIYRLLIGAALGLFISGLHLLDLRASIQMGMSSYLPGIIIHAAAAPFILMPLLRNAYSRQNKRAVSQPFSSATTATSSQSAPVMQRYAELHPSRVDSHPQVHESPSMLHGANGFDRATRYIGEHNAVAMAAVVDHEGLLMSHFVRGGVDPEMWAPFAVQFVQSNSQILERGRWGAPDRLDITMQEWRVVVCREQSFALMVVAERHGDDLLAIRINQGLEIIRKYYSDRYSQKPAVNPERSYVPSA